MRRAFRVIGVCALILLNADMIGSAQADEPLPASATASVSQPTDLDDVLQAIAACRPSLQSGDNPPYADGWGVRKEMSGSPRVIAAMKANDMQAMFASMGNNRTVFGRDGKPATLTIYYSKMQYVACAVDVTGEPTSFPAMREALIAKLGLDGAKSLNSSFKNIKFQYLLDDVNDAYRKDGFAYAFHVGMAEGKDTLTIFLTRD
jgi:hypothetical protein